MENLSNFMTVSSKKASEALDTSVRWLLSETLPGYRH
jgi:hypothetical protein